MLMGGIEALDQPAAVLADKNGEDIALVPRRGDRRVVTPVDQDSVAVAGHEDLDRTVFVIGDLAAETGLGLEAVMIEFFVPGLDIAVFRIMLVGG